MQFSPYDSILVAFNVDDYSPIYFIKTDDYSFIAKWEKTERFRKENQLLSTGINYKMIDNAISNFVSEIMNKRTLKSSILCAKDPQFIDNV